MTDVSIRMLVLELVDAKGASQVRELHVEVRQRRPETSEHKLRAWLSEAVSDGLMSRLGYGFHDVLCADDGGEPCPDLVPPSLQLDDLDLRITFGIRISVYGLVFDPRNNTCCLRRVWYSMGYKHWSLSGKGPTMNDCSPRLVRSGMDLLL